MRRATGGVEQYQVGDMTLIAYREPSEASCAAMMRQQIRPSSPREKTDE
jgi:hypothetical protein